MATAQRTPRAFEALLSAQHGTFTRRQARDTGFSDAAIARRVADGAWIRMHPRVYRPAAWPRSWRQRAMGAVLWAGEGAVLSHRAAGALWRLDGVTHGPVEVVVPAERRIRTERVAVHRTIELPVGDRRVVDSIPATSPERTLVDLAGVLDERALEAPLVSALNQGLTTAARVAERLQALAGRGRPGWATLAQLVEIHDGRPLESPLEVDVERFLRERGLDRYFVRQHEVWDGTQTRRLDFAAPELEVALEADSWRHHSARRAWFRDQARNDALEARGWRFVTVTASAVSDTPDLLDARIRAALERAA